jgi:[acyl-carrier-protein] S-malonyltransferase
MPMSWAFLFPGQGSQHVGMGADLVAEFPEARRTMQEADDALAYSLGRLCTDGPEDRLALTEYAQPAILAVSVAVLRVLVGRRGDQPLIVAGHSLGEYTALVAAGVLEFSVALQIVRARGRLMQEAVSPGVGGMTAIVGIDAADIEQWCAATCQDGEVVGPANYNGAGQIVIAGHAAAVDRVATLAKEHGARLVRRLPVSAPFHCALMNPAARGLTTLLRAVPFRTPRVHVVSNLDGAVVSDPGELAQRLARQVEQPVRWDRCMATVASRGCTHALELGPGNTLSALARRTDLGLTSRPVGTAAALHELLNGAVA